MRQAGCGAEIARIVRGIPYEDMIQTEDVAEQLAGRLSIPYDKARAAVNVKLKRMSDAGELKRLRKGVYCHVARTAFGPVAPDIDQLVAKSVTVKNGARIGYESGASLMNRLGLTTLLPRTMEITTNQYGIRLPEGCHIKLARPVAAVTDDNWKYLQFLDAASYLPSAHVDAADPNQIMNTLVRKQGLDPLKLIFTARMYYPSKTVLRLTDLLMEANHETAPG